MKIVIFGSTGKTGQHVWRKALDHGHEITVFVRSPEKIQSDNSFLHIVQGDVFDEDSVSSAVVNHDAAIVCLGSTGLGDKTTLTAGTNNVVDGMIRHNVKRLIVVSAAGVHDSWAQIPWFARLLFKTLLRNIFADHHKQEDLILKSPLEWIIVRAAVLTDNPGSGSYTVSNSRSVTYRQSLRCSGFFSKTSIRQKLYTASNINYRIVKFHQIGGQSIIGCLI